MIPNGLVYVNVSNRNGVVANYDYIFSSVMKLSEFNIIGANILAAIKNFGESPLPEIKSNALILTVLGSIETFRRCNSFELVPVSVNGVLNTEETVYIIPFSKLLSIVPLQPIPLEQSPTQIYALTNIVRDSLPDVYVVDYSVYELWYFLNNCEFPPVPPYYGVGALGESSFLNL